MFNKITKSEHYNQGAIETIEIINQITDNYDGYTAFCVGQVIKYLARATFKGSYRDDLLKAQYYMNQIIKHLGDDENGE